MKFLKLIFFVLLIFCVTDLRAIDVRWFVSWPDEKIEKINKLEKEIKAELENKADYKIILSKFNEYIKLDNENENIMEYLNATLELSDALSKNKGSKNLRVLDLRNRLINIYSDWQLRYRAELETRLLNNLYQVLLKSKVPSDRTEAVMAIRIVGNQDSVKELEKYLNDPDKTVKDQVIEELKRLRENYHPYATYKETLKFYNSLSGH